MSPRPPRPAPAALAAAVAACLALSGCAAGRKTLPPADPLRYGGVQATFTSGLRLYVLQFEGTQRTTVVASYASGAADDPPGKEGTAALGARLTGFARTVAGGFARGERVLSTGARQGVEPRASDVEWRMIGRAAALDELLAIEVDRLRAPLEGVLDSDFIGAREAFAAEVEDAWSDPDGDPPQRSALLERALAGTPLARSPTAASIRAIAVEDVRAWARRTFDPARAVVVVTSPRAPREVLARFQAALGPLTGEGAPRVAPHSPPAIDTATLTRAGDLETISTAGKRARLRIAWALPGDTTGGLARAEGAAALVQARALFRPILEQDLAERITGVRVELHRDGRVAVLELIVDLREAADAPRVRAALVDAVTTEKFDAGWSRGLGRAAGRFSEAALLAPDDGVEDAARLVRSRPDTDPLRARRELVLDLGVQGMRAYFRQHVTAGRAVAVLFAPSPGEAEPPPAGPPPARDARPLARALSASVPGADAIRALVVGPAVGTGTRWTLPNGLEVLVLPRAGAPVVDARLVFRTRPGDAPAAVFAATLSTASARSAWTMLGPLEARCDATALSTRDGALTARAVVAAAHLPAALERLGCWTRLRLDRGEAYWSRAFAASFVERLARTDVLRAADALSAEAYGGAHRALPARAEIEALDDDRLRGWLDATLRPDRALLVLAGAVAPTPDLVVAVERAFGGWRRSAAATGGPGRRPTPGRSTLVLVDSPGAPRANIWVAARLPPRAAADDAAENVLAGAAALRFQELHAGPRVSIAAAVGGAEDEPVLRLDVGGVPLGGAAAAVTGALDALARLAREPAPADELRLARWLAAVERAYAFDTLAGAASAAELLFVRDRPLDALDGMGEELATVDGARVQRAAAALGLPVVVVIGDAAALEPSLRAAGLAPSRISRRP